MPILKNLTTDSSIKGETDSLGSGGLWESGTYPLTIKVAYLSTAASGALALNTVAAAGEKEIKQQFWMTSGTEKGSKNYYEKNGEKHYLPGFIAANSLALLTLGKEIGELDVEKKVIKVYDFESKKEVPTEVDAFVDLHGQEIKQARQQRGIAQHCGPDIGDAVKTQLDAGLQQPPLDRGAGIEPEIIMIMLEQVLQQKLDFNIVLRI